MTLIDLFREVYTAIVANKFRSGLTVLGIIIGISSVVVLLAIGAGTQKSIEERIQSIGSNLIMVQPSFGRGQGAVNQGRGSVQTLTIDDFEKISKEIDGIRAISPEINGRRQVIYQRKNTNTQVIGVSDTYQHIRALEIDVGDFFTEQQVANVSRFAVLGSTTKTDLFGDDDAIKKRIRIGGIDFTVIGIIKSKGQSGFGSQDDRIIIPYTTAQRYFSKNNYISSIQISSLFSGEEMIVVQEKIQQLLLSIHKINNPAQADFSVVNQSDIIDTASSITKTLTGFLISVAAISLIVGGIGIMNMMLTNVTERIREIGLRKAVGASKKNIRMQFLFEAIVLTSIGGVCGIILGIVISFILEYFFNIASDVSLNSILVSVLVSSVIGIVFGYIPARTAANLSPIDALRHE